MTDSNFLSPLMAAFYDWFNSEDSNLEINHEDETVTLEGKTYTPTTEEFFYIRNMTERLFNEERE